jgi:hypothetical protein
MATAYINDEFARVKAEEEGRSFGRIRIQKWN